ncbi:MAG: hypothetical protein LBE11_01405, partial [Prevotellaceae bacterium]|nr:hypothetical protein [Prevotellaceae bacterium]
MKKPLIFIFILIFLLPYPTHSQIDTANINHANNEFSLSPLIIPAALISYGIATRLFKPLQQYDHNMANEIAKHYKYSTKA